LEALLDSVMAWSWLVYSFIFLAMFIESIGLPIPGLTVALAGAALAGQARLEFWLVFSLTILGGTLGGLVSYWIGCTGGRRFMGRWGKYFLITPDRLALGEQYFNRHGPKILLAARYLPLLCFWSGLLSGLTRLSYRRFFLYNILSISLWSSTHLTLGYLFGRNLDTLLQVFNNLGLAMVGIIALGAVWFFLKRWKRRLKLPPHREGELTAETARLPAEN
jgi:membrane protein DedA with SNARE-associated domain